MARVLLLWIELVLLALPLLAFLGLSRSSWNLLVERSKPFPPHTFNKTFWKDAFLVSALVFGLALITVVAVFKVAWVSEDSFITFRYISNALHGFGPVFNLGERVQGYTHPLWFVLLLLGSRIIPNPIYISIGYGLALTFLTVVILGYTLSRIVANRLTLAILLVLACLLGSLSDPWLSFQTSGLENALSNLLIAGILIETWIYSIRRPGWLMLLICLLCLTRPDFIILTLPFLILLLGRIRSVRTLVAVVIATFPALAWLVYSWTYYGSVVPNTAYAKLGIYPNWIAAVSQGVLYLQDWLTYDMVAAVSTVLLLGFATFAARSKERWACVIGIVLYTAWIVWIGGDFMRGRMLTPVFTSAIVVGFLALAELSTHLRGRAILFATGAAACLILTLFFLQKSVPDPGGEISEANITNERIYYPGYSLSYLLKHGHLQNPYTNLQLAEGLRHFADVCGPITIHLRNPGTVGYLAGPNVSVIDTLGLTDAYIAGLPREFLISDHPRPGHPDKYIPVSYLVSRHDVAILPGWKNSIWRLDCSLSSKLAGFQYPSDLYQSP
jgi:arabinofuranosyltransferase